MSGRKLNPDERQIWHVVTRTVTPLHTERADFDREINCGPETESVGRKTGKASETKRSPVAGNHKPLPADRSSERRLRRGRLEIDGRIDLHGMTQAAARAALGRFLHSARARGFHAVLVITGKGKAGSRDREPGEAAPGIIRRKFPDWLTEPELRHLVSGYSSAHRRHGGDGAYYVMIRNR
ncbi:MAG: smr protein/Muts2-like [Hyphobacterium sp.]|nr:MAG: smr protein/Muts2-like [Hyphobacterium sp.]